MFIKKSLTPKWCLEHSLFLRKLYEDSENEEYIFIPILLQYDQRFNFSEIFDNDLPYIHPRFFYIYFDAIQFLEFIQFNIPFHKLIKPQMYTFLPISDQIKENIKLKIIGIQHYAFGFSPHKFMNQKNDFKKNDYLIDLKKSIEHNQCDWLKWFIQRFQDQDFIEENPITYAEDKLFDIDFTNVSVQTFDLIKNELYMNPFAYPNVCENIIKTRNISILMKYQNEFYNSYNYESLLKIAFMKNQNENDEDQLEFIKKIIEKRGLFHFDSDTIQYTLDSNNVLLMNYIYEHYEDKMKYAVVPLYRKLYDLSRQSPKIEFKIKCNIVDFMLKRYNHVLKSAFIIDSVYIKNKDLYENQRNNSYYDYDFIYYFVKSIEQEFQGLAYSAAVLLDAKKIIENYHIHHYNKEQNSYNMNAFRNKFRIVVRCANMDYIRFYIKNRLYVNDENGYNDYLKYGSYNITIFKLLYDNGFRNLNDELFLEVFREGECNIASFMIQQKFKPNKETLDKIKSEIEKYTKMKNLLNENSKTPFMNIQSSYNEEMYTQQLKIYNMIR